VSRALSRTFEQTLCRHCQHLAQLFAEVASDSRATVTGRRRTKVRPDAQTDDPAVAWPCMILAKRGNLRGG
jgi:hypothetical protein